MAFWQKNKVRMPIFEKAILDKNGYPVKITFAKYLGKRCMRFQTKIAKPLQPGSTKLKIDNSPESRIYRFCIKFVEVVVNKDSDVEYALSEVNALQSDPLAPAQTRHHDFERYSEQSLVEKPNASFVIAIGERASMNVWPYTQDITHACHKVEQGLVPPNKMYSQVRNILLNSPKKINIDECKMQEVYFGVDEYLGFLDNTVHGGAPNHMEKTLFRLHFYVVRKDAVAPTSYTFFPSDLVWDVTRNDTQTDGIYASDLQKDPVLSKNFVFFDDGGIEEVDEDDIVGAEDDVESQGASGASDGSSVPKKRGRPPTHK